MNTLEATPAPPPPSPSLADKRRRYSRIANIIIGFAMGGFISLMLVGVILHYSYEPTRANKPTITLSLTERKGNQHFTTSIICAEGEAPTRWRNGAPACAGPRLLDGKYDPLPPKP